MPSGRVAAVAICIFAILMALAVISYGASRDRFALASAASEPCMDERTREQLRNMMLGALDQAFHQHIVLLHEVWMKDQGSEAGQKRAATGTSHGISAYMRARNGFRNWNPPICP